MTYQPSLSPAVEKGFRATYEVITAESCEAGDASDRGWLDWPGDAVDNAWDSHWDLQDLMRLQDYRLEGDGADLPRWVTADADMSDLMQRARPWGFLADHERRGDGEPIGGSISIHRPDWITDASWLRVLRAMGWQK